jgi:replication factor C small subunit
MGKFVCPAAGCEKELSRLQVMHFRSAHERDPVDWVERQYGSEIKNRYADGEGSYAIASDYEWLSSDMVCQVVETRSPQESLSGDTNPMKRDEVIDQFCGDTNPAKRPEVRKKISNALTGHTHTEETKRKISRKNRGNKITEEHRRKIAAAASERDTSYMQTPAYSQALSKALKGREPTYPKPYDVAEISHSVRSSWEEKVAKSLANHDIPYDYEPEFELSIGSYFPDFMIDDIVIEVKGFANERSVAKATAFMNEFPEYSYVVVGDEIPCDIHMPWKERKELIEVITDG